LAGLRSSYDRNFEGRPLGRKDCQPLTFLHAISPALEQFTQHGAHVTRPIDNSQALSAGRRIVQFLAKPRYKSSVASVNYSFSQSDGFGVKPQNFLPVGKIVERLSLREGGPCSEPSTSQTNQRGSYKYERPHPKRDIAPQLGELFARKIGMDNPRMRICLRGESGLDHQVHSLGAFDPAIGSRDPPDDW